MSNDKHCEVCRDKNDPRLLKKEIQQLRADKQELVEEFKAILYDFEFTSQHEGYGCRARMYANTANDMIKKYGGGNG